MDTPKVTTTRYDAVAVSESGYNHIQELRELCEKAAFLLDMYPGRLSSVALTHLESCVFFGTRAIAVVHRNLD